MDSVPINKPLAIRLECRHGTVTDYLEALRRGFWKFFVPARLEAFQGSSRSFEVDVSPDWRGSTGKGKQVFGVVGEIVGGVGPVGGARDWWWALSDAPKVFPFEEVTGHLNPEWAWTTTLKEFRRRDARIFDSVTLTGATRLKARSGLTRWRVWARREALTGRPILTLKISDRGVAVETTSRAFNHHVPEVWDYSRPWADANLRSLARHVDAVAGQLVPWLQRVWLDHHAKPPAFLGVEFDRFDAALSRVRAYEPAPPHVLRGKVSRALVDAVDQLLEVVEKFVLDARSRLLDDTDSCLLPNELSLAQSYLSALRQLLSELLSSPSGLTGISLNTFFHDYVPTRVRPVFFMLRELVELATWRAGRRAR
ncbi:MAG: hypothetical protein Kow0069_09200 [Promethearchaeota archaeon]